MKIQSQTDQRKLALKSSLEVKPSSVGSLSSHLAVTRTQSWKTEPLLVFHTCHRIWRWNCFWTLTESQWCSICYYEPEGQHEKRREAHSGSWWLLSCHCRLFGSCAAGWCTSCCCCSSVEGNFFLRIYTFFLYICCQNIVTRIELPVSAPSVFQICTCTFCAYPFDPQFYSAGLMMCFMGIVRIYTWMELCQCWMKLKFRKSGNNLAGIPWCSLSFPGGACGWQCWLCRPAERIPSFAEVAKFSVMLGHPCSTARCSWGWCLTLSM